MKKQTLNWFVPGREQSALSRIRISNASAITVVVCRVAIGVTGLIWLASGDELSFSVAVVALLLTTLPTRIIRESLLHDVTAALIAVLLTAHIVLGMHIELYETSTVYDKVIHTLGSSAFAGILIIAIRSLCNRYSVELPLTVFCLMVFGGTLSAGTLWEIFEFAIDHTGLFNAQRGLHDTMVDLIADAIGAVLTTSIYAAAILVKNNVAASWQQLFSCKALIAVLHQRL